MASLRHHTKEAFMKALIACLLVSALLIVKSNLLLSAEMEFSFNGSWASLDIKSKDGPISTFRAFAVSDRKDRKDAMLLVDYYVGSCEDPAVLLSTWMDGIAPEADIFTDVFPAEIRVDSQPILHLIARVFWPAGKELSFLRMVPPQGEIASVIEALKSGHYVRIKLGNNLYRPTLSRTM